jgi:regulator of protease activity HflC (stomatin/prohibitin superfamily)
MDFMVFLGLAAVVFAITFMSKMVRIVPQQMAYVVERLGRYRTTLGGGMHITVPFLDQVRERHDLKETVLDIPEQICITKDNVQVNIDGVLFYRIVDPARATYGVANFRFAIAQLAQTTLRSEIGRIDLDRTFEERDKVNGAVVLAIDAATDPWGVKVLRYELKSISPPKEVINAMEKQMRAEREKRAKILESEGDRDSRINRAEGEKQETIKASEANRQKRINEAEGQAAAIYAVAKATAEGLAQVAEVLKTPGGRDAAQLRVAEEYVKEFGKFAADSQAIIVPANATDMSSMIGTAFSVFKNLQKVEPGSN